MEKNIVQHDFKISRTDRNKLNKHNSFVVWFTGFSGSGKSTLANALEQKLHQDGIRTFVLDGDCIRKGLCSDLTFSPEGRTENIRRMGEVAKLIMDAGVVVLAAFVSPYKKGREDVRNIVSPENFVEVYVNTSLEICESRDVKGLYKKARQGVIKDFTGISAPYERPENPDVEVAPVVSVDEAVAKVYSVIKTKL